MMTLRTSCFVCSLILFSSCKGSLTGTGGDGDGDASTGGITSGDGDGDQMPSVGGTPNTATGGRNGTGGTGGSTGGSLSMGGLGGDPVAMGGDSMGMGGAGTGGEYQVPADAVPSAGCSSPATTPEDMTSSSGTVYVSTPDGYDGSTPRPLVLGFPAFGGRLDNLLSAAQHPLDTESILRRDYVVVRAGAQTSSEGTWEGDGIEPFDEVYQMVRENVCFDESRVFGVGNEGGARYLTKHVCEAAPGDLVGPSIFRALAIVGFQTLPCDPWPNMPLIFLSSVDTETSFGDPDGTVALEDFKESKSCEDTSTSAGTWPTSTNPSFDYVCEDFDGCTSDLRFCNWTQPIDDLDIWLSTHNEHLHRFFADYL